MARIRSICPNCGRIVPARQTCGCRKDTRTHAERLAKMPWRAAYSDPAYRRNRAARYEIARGLCEGCGVQLMGSIHPQGVAWECDHAIEARHFADPMTANAVENLRVLCRDRCHKLKTRERRRAD